MIRTARGSNVIVRAARWADGPSTLEESWGSHRCTAAGPPLAGRSLASHMGKTDGIRHLDSASNIETYRLSRMQCYSTPLDGMNVLACCPRGRVWPRSNLIRGADRLKVALGHRPWTRPASSAEVRSQGRVIATFRNGRPLELPGPTNCVPFMRQIRLIRSMVLQAGQEVARALPTRPSLSVKIFPARHARVSTTNHGTGKYGTAEGAWGTRANRNGPTPISI